MAALTIASVANSSNENSSSLFCRGHDIGLRITTNAEVTLNPQVSQDNTTFYGHPMSLTLDGSDVVPQNVVLASGSYTFVFTDVFPFSYFRVNVANASGGAATVTLDAVQHLHRQQ